MNTNEITNQPQSIGTEFNDVDRLGVVLRKEVTFGVISFTRSERRDGEKPCICCPGEPGHIHSRGVKFGPFNDLYPEHFGHGVSEFLGSVALYENSYEGKRVRVTIEVLDD
jgi:hypothetical protein